MQAEARCSVCHATIAGPREWCARCESPYHPECWAYQGGCARYACAPIEAATWPPGKTLARTPPESTHGILGRWTHPAWVRLLALVAALTLSYEHPAAFGNACVLCTPFCFLRTFHNGLLFLYHLLRGSSRDACGALMRASLWLAGILLTTIGVWIGLVLGTWKMERTCAPVMAALELHRARAGRYPQHLGELVPDFLARIPEGVHDSGSRASPFEITYHGSDSTSIPGTSYTLTGWLSQGMFRCSYRSTSGTWEIWD